MKPTDLAWRRPVARTLTLAWLESLTIRRDPVILAMILLIPTLQIVLFGYAIRPLSGETPVVIARVEPDLALVNLLRDSGAFRVVADGLSREEALAVVRNQGALMALVIPPAATAGAEAVRVFVDDSDLARADPALARLEALYWRRAGEGDPFRPAEVRVERLYNPERRHEWVLTPGLSGVVAMISMLMLGALSIVRERERGTWEALLATPVHAAEAVVGKALPYLVLGLVQAALGHRRLRAALRAADAGKPLGVRAVSGRLPVRSPRAGVNDFRGGQEPASGRAGRRARLYAFHAVVGVHLPVLNHADVGTTARGRAAVDPLQRGRPRRHAARGGRRLRSRPHLAGGRDRRRGLAGGGRGVPTTVMMGFHRGRARVCKRRARVKCCPGSGRHLAVSLGPVGALDDALKVGGWMALGTVTPYQKGSHGAEGFRAAEAPLGAPAPPVLPALPALFAGRPAAAMKHDG